MDNDIFTKVDNFFQKYPKRAYPKDQIIVFGGDNPGKVFYVVSGKISQYDISYRGDEIITNIFKSPAFFPMSIALNHNANHFFYKAEIESVVRCAPPADVVAFLKANPDVMLNLLSRLYIGIEATMGRMVHLMSGTAKSRLVYELIIESKRFGKKTDEGIYLLDINETQLASRSGLSRETVSREMNRLKKIEAIAIRPHEIQVLDLDKLEALVTDRV